jgi:hypothetical protein
MRKLFALVTLGLLFTTLCFTALLQSPKFSYVNASSISTADNAEYADGTLTIPDSYCLIRYSWINVSGTQVINYVLYTNSDYPYPTPVISLVGQFFRLADGTKISVMSALDKIEIYKDTNGDGIPEANFTSGQSEILYYAYVNMSDSYGISPIEKVTENNVSHYKWGFTYVNVYAYLINATANSGVVAKLTFDHITLGYDFSVKSNVSSLKTNFDIGNVTSITVLESSQLSLNGLSLALLYPTCTHTSEPYSTYVGGQQFNSTISNETAINLPLARVVVGTTKAYDFVFGGNYTLIRGQNNETHELKSEAASLSSVPTDVYGLVLWQESFFRDNLNLGDLFRGSPPDISVDYNESSLIYRICFPVWDGMEVQNDPVYVGYLFSSEVVPEIPTTMILALMVVVTTSLALALAKKRQRARSCSSPQKLKTTTRALLTD